MREDLAFALAAGTLAAVNPCGFAMLPAYLTLFVSGEVAPGAGARTDRRAALVRALTATTAMTLGFLAVFGTFGLLLTPVASTVQRWAPAVSVVIGAALVLLGLVMLTGRAMVLRTPKLHLGRSPVAGHGAMAMYGVSYAVASLGCTIGPFLVVTTTTFRSGDVVTGIASYAAYAAGMGLVVGALAVTAALAQQTVARILRRAAQHVTRVGGGLLVLAGAYVAWYGSYELRVYAGASADDPVVSAASTVQGKVADAVSALGPATFALLILALGAVSFGARAARRRRAAADAG